MPVPTGKAVIGQISSEGRPWGPYCGRLSLTLVHEESLREAEQYAKEALRWLITERLASAVTVRVSHTEADHEQISIDVTLTDGAQKTFYVVSTRTAPHHP